MAAPFFLSSVPDTRLVQLASMMMMSQRKIKRSQKNEVSSFLHEVLFLQLATSSIQLFCFCTLLSPLLYSWIPGLFHVSSVGEDIITLSLIASCRHMVVGILFYFFAWCHNCYFIPSGHHLVHVGHFILILTCSYGKHK